MRTAVVAATGPSFSLQQARLIGIAKNRGRIDLIAVNDAVYPLWMADICYASDGKWWEFHRGLPEFHGMKIRLEHHDGGRDINAVPFDDVERVVSTGSDGIDLRNGFVRHGGNGGYQAIQVACHYGADKIILVGFDMHADANQNHWFGRHPGTIRKQPNIRPWLRRYAQMVGLLADAGIEVVNCSPGSALGFRKGDLAKELGVHDV